MKTVLFGGTTEGRNISRKLAQMGAEVTVSVVSEYGAKQQGDQSGIRVITGSRTTDEMIDLIKDADLVIDATHPFAVEASANISEACSRAGVRRIRLVREREDISGDEGEERGSTVLYAKSREEAAELALEASENPSARRTEGEGSEAIKGNVLLTTGVRDLPFYCEKLGTIGTYARVLPSRESIEACLDSGMEPSNIIAMQGPFSAGLNEAIIREFDIKVLVTKESGRTGGFVEKLKACENCGIKTIVISRPEEEGLTYEETIEECSRLIAGE